MLRPAHAFSIGLRLGGSAPNFLFPFTTSEIHLLFSRAASYESVSAFHSPANGHCCLTLPSEVLTPVLTVAQLCFVLVLVLPEGRPAWKSQDPPLLHLEVPFVVDNRWWPY